MKQISAESANIEASLNSANHANKQLKNQVEVAEEECE